MADHTKIEWTDSTWNPITGCSVTSPGCKHCYAMQLAGTRLKHHESRAGLTQDTSAGPVWTGEVRFNSQWLDQPLRWKRPRKIFVCAHSDLFHESVPDEWIDKVFAVMALARRHIFQVLTKRAKRMREYFSALTRDRIEEAAREMGYTFRHSGAWLLALPLPNVWLGVSIEDQKRADERIPDLLATPAAVRWVSAEPLLGPVDLEPYITSCDGCGNQGSQMGYLVGYDQHAQSLCGKACSRSVIGGEGPAIDWVVVGGESGPKARPMHPQWARDLRDQCAEAGVPFLFKQWGEWVDCDSGPEDDALYEGKADCWAHIDGGHHDGAMGIDFFHTHPMYRVGKKAAGRLLDGVLHDGYPEVQS